MKKIIGVLLLSCGLSACGNYYAKGYNRGYNDSRHIGGKIELTDYERGLIDGSNAITLILYLEKQMGKIEGIK